MESGVVTLYIWLSFAHMENSDLWNLDQKGIGSSRHKSWGRFIWKLSNIYASSLTFSHLVYDAFSFLCLRASILISCRTGEKREHRFPQCLLLWEIFTVSINLQFSTETNWECLWCVFNVLRWLTFNLLNNEETSKKKARKKNPFIYTCDKKK